MWAFLAKNESGFESKNSRDLSGGGEGGGGEKGSTSTNQPKSDLSYRKLQHLELFHEREIDLVGFRSTHNLLPLADLRLRQ